MTVPRVLSIAGSDSGGGAGIQADLKTFTALNVYGMTAITAITAQNTLGVSAVHVLPTELVTGQIDAVASDIGVDAVKIGMLANAAIVEAVATALERHAFKHVVLDPVMIATSGDPLLDADAVSTLTLRLLPCATIVTPNIPEAEALAGIAISDDASLKRAAQCIHKSCGAQVLIKGGHGDGLEIVDLLFDGRAFKEFRSARIETRNTHGTGCTLSAAIAAHLAGGLSVEDAVEKGLDYVHQAILAGFSIGKGHGPLNHMTHLPTPID